MVADLPTRYRAPLAFLLIGTAFAFALSLHLFSFETFRLYDANVWGKQALYVQTGNPEQFNWEAAYGHPGGTLIVGTSLVQFATKGSYEDALILFLSLADAVLITAICIVTYLLRRNFMWSLSTYLFLTLNPLYLVSTPPSVLASLLTVLLASVTLLLYERRSPPTVREALAWGALAGLAGVTRIDIGLLASVCFGLLIYQRFGIRHLLIAFGAAVSAFVALDPFMWFMPLQHLYDLTIKIYQHVALISLEHPSAVEFIDATSIAALGVLLALVRFSQEPKTVPRAFMGALLVMTGIVLGIYALAHNQALRYLQPIIFLWQWLLPLLLITMSEALPQPARTRGVIHAVLLFLLLLYPVLIFSIHAL